MCIIAESDDSISVSKLSPILRRCAASPATVAVGGSAVATGNAYHHHHQPITPYQASSQPFANDFHSLKDVSSQIY